MGLNRQQRRAMAKRNKLRREIEDQYIKEVNNYANNINNEFFEQFFVAVGLALNDLYGWKQQGITKVWNKTYSIINDYGEDVDRFRERRQELKEKANVAIEWTKEAAR